MQFSRYLKWFSIVLIGFFAQLSIGFLVLLLAREHWSVNEVVAEQARTGGWYGTALHATDVSYPLVLYGTRKTAVVAVGSSRVLQIRGEFFQTPFTNMGRTVSSVLDAEKIFDKILSLHKPKVVFFGVDTWWFPATWAQDNAFSMSNQGGWPSIMEAQTAVEWVLSGKVSLKEIEDLILHKVNDFGILAVLGRMGRDRFGSFHEEGVVTGLAPSRDAGFARSLEVLGREEAFFTHAEKIDSSRFQKFLSIVNRLKNEGVDVVVFLPPFAPTVMKAMEDSGGFGYFDDLRRSLSAHDIPFFDFSDASSFGAGDCEFLDGYHGGPVTYARMLLAMVKEAPRLREYVDVVTLNDLVTRYGGRASILSDRERSGRAEVDFLKLGCLKSGM